MIKLGLIIGQVDFGILNNERTVEPLYNSLDQPIELVAEQEHTEMEEIQMKKRGDVGPAEVTEN